MSDDELREVGKLIEACYREGGVEISSSAAWPTHVAYAVYPIIERQVRRRVAANLRQMAAEASEGSLPGLPGGAVTPAQCAQFAIDTVCIAADAVEDGWAGSSK